MDLQALLRTEFERAADPAKAGPMQAYMKSAMPYYGIQAAPLRALLKRIFDAHPVKANPLSSSPVTADIVSPSVPPAAAGEPSSAGSPAASKAWSEAWQAQCLVLWREARFREEWYAAIALTGHRYYLPLQNLRVLPMYEEMIVTGAWWDIVDSIAPHRLGALLRLHPRAMRAKMLQWSRGKNLWKRRSSILCQLTFKSQTDLDLLYAAIEPSLDSREFFLRKAIGWALREYAWTDPQEVVRYVRAHERHLSPLSVREALKNVRA